MTTQDDDTEPDDSDDGDDRDKYATYPTAAFLDAVDALEWPTTPEVAERVGCRRNTAHGRLTDLEDDGLLVSRKVGASLVWALPEDEDGDSDNADD